MGLVVFFGFLSKGTQENQEEEKAVLNSLKYCAPCELGHGC